MKIMNFLPKFLRIALIRRNIIVPKSPENFEVHVAATQHELENAYKLLHDCYVDSKLMSADPSGLRCNFFTFLPHTTTIVAKLNDSVIGTVSLIKDSSAGLPSDKDFKNENDQLRLNGHCLVEVSSLCIDRQFRKKAHYVSFYLMKYLQHYCVHKMGCSTVTCVVHPRATDFYEALWGFETNKRIVKYKFVNGALGAHAYGSILDENLKSLTKKFSDDPSKNPISFLFNTNHDFLIYPDRSMSYHIDTIYTPELLKHFLFNRTQCYRNFSRSELLYIYRAYSLFFKNLENLPFFDGFHLLKSENRIFRYPTKIPAKLIKKDSINKIVVDIMDLSFLGAFISTNLDLDIDNAYTMDFELGGKRYSIQITPRWRNRRSRNHQMLGYGVQFLEPDHEISRLLGDTHLTKTLESQNKVAKKAS